MTLKRLSRFVLSLFAFFVFSAPVFSAAFSDPEKVFKKPLCHDMLDKGLRTKNPRSLMNAFIEAVNAYWMGENKIGPVVYGASFNVVINGQLKTIELDLESLREGINSEEFGTYKFYQDLLLKQFEKKLGSLVSKKEDLFSDKVFLYQKYLQAGFLYLEPFRIAGKTFDLVDYLDHMISVIGKDDQKRWDHLWFVLKDVASLLQKMHEMNLVHGDFKAENILLAGRVALTDFEVMVLKNFPTPLLAVAKKTASYLSPQLFYFYQRVMYRICSNKKDCLLNENDLRPEDMWAFGVMAYYLSTEMVLHETKISYNEDPFDEAEDKRKIYAFMNQSKETLISAIEAKISEIKDPELRELITNLLKYDSADRWTAEQAAQFCDKVITDRNLKNPNII